MKYKKIVSGWYESENGYTIKRVKVRGGIIYNYLWNVYDNKGNRIDCSPTLQEAKEIIENIEEVK